MVTTKRKRSRGKQVRQLVAQARNGDQESAAAALMGIATGDDPYESWVATASLLGWYWWTGDISGAANAVQTAIERFGAQADELDLPGDIDFETAILADAFYTGAARESRLGYLAGLLPADHDLAAGLTRSAQRVGTAPQYGLPLALNPHRSAMPEPVPAAERIRQLSTAQREALWTSATSVGDAAALVRLYQADPAVPGNPMIIFSCAEALAGAGATTEAEEVLIGARHVWLPYTDWETLSPTPPLCPGLHELITDRVRAAFFTHPVADTEWRP